MHVCIEMEKNVIELESKMKSYLLDPVNNESCQKNIYVAIEYMT